MIEFSVTIFNATIVISNSSVALVVIIICLCAEDFAYLLPMFSHHHVLDELHDKFFTAHEHHFTYLIYYISLHHFLYVKGCVLCA